MNKEITFEIIEHYGIFDDSSEDWVGEVNLVSWNNKDPKLDIRYWKRDYSKSRKVGSLPSKDIGRKLAEIILNL